MDDRPTVTVTFDKRGDPYFRHTPGVRLLIIDERAPLDRVFEYEDGSLTPAEIEAMIADDAAGEPSARTIPKRHLSLVVDRDRDPDPPSAA